MFVWEIIVRTLELWSSFDDKRTSGYRQIAGRLNQSEISEYSLVNTRRFELRLIRSNRWISKSNLLPFPLPLLDFNSVISKSHKSKFFPIVPWDHLSDRMIISCALLYKQKGECMPPKRARVHWLLASLLFPALLDFSRPGRPIVLQINSATSNNASFCFWRAVRFNFRPLPIVCVQYFLLFFEAVKQ